MMLGQADKCLVSRVVYCLVFVLVIHLDRQVAVSFGKMRYEFMKTRQAKKGLVDMHIHHDDKLTYYVYKEG